MHLDIIVTQSIFPRDLIALGEMVDALILIKSFIKVALARACRPEHIPLVRVSIIEAIGLKDASNQLRLTLQKLVQHFLIFDMIATTRALSRKRRLQ